MGDTSDVEMFGVKLKMIATQDPGERDRNLWTSFDVTLRDNSKEVVRVAEAAIREQETPCLQYLCDQGTPYVARSTRTALEALDIEHCPQKEYTATAKATLDRSFRTVKGVIEPIVEWSNELARRVPQLRNANLARCVGRLVIAAMIDAHRIGSESRVSRQSQQDPEEIRRVIEEMRDQARADERSKRLFLERMHREYQMEGTQASFIRSLTGFALEDIREAESRFRDVIPKQRGPRTDRYFVGILRGVQQEGRERRRLERRNAKARRDDRRREREYLAEMEALEQNPQARIERGLRLIRLQWDEANQELLQGGSGIGRIDLREGLGTLRERAGPLFFKPAARTCWDQWLRTEPKLSAAGVRAVRRVWDSVTASEKISQGGLASVPDVARIPTRPLTETAASPDQTLRN